MFSLLDMNKLKREKFSNSRGNYKNKPFNKHNFLYEVQNF